MNAVEIEEAISQLAEQPFDAQEFPYAFLQAFGNKETTIKRLRSGATNRSDVGGVLQTNHIHIAVAQEGEVSRTLASLRESKTTAKAKAKFILATDGNTLEAEALASGDIIACNFSEFPDHFGFLLPLAGITTVKAVEDSAVDIRATGRLNRLYVQLLRDNPDWAEGERSPDMNHFMARLIFCFFAEDTSIFHESDLFTQTVDQMSARDASNIHEVIGEIFRAMNTRIPDRSNPKTPRWADAFPYVNGGLFSGSVEVPFFSKMAGSYLLEIGRLDWTKINPDIFGSMIQAVADDDERGELGMHYTSVPNILKVLDPLFLDDLREKLEAAGDNPRKLINLRKRIAKVRVFDPACGSGNFLVIAYKQMRDIEHAINVRRGESGRKSEIPLTNFRGIELRDFSAEIARLALIIAEYQCNVEYLGQKEALVEFLPLEANNWITCGNALRLDWLSICPSTSTSIKAKSDDLFESPLEQTEINFEDAREETYICGNPPYMGDKKQTRGQKSDMELVFSSVTKRWKSFDYICGFVFKASNFVSQASNARAALVSTNSVCQGVQAAEFWPLVLSENKLFFAHLSFRWSNLASHNAGVTCVIVGVTEKTDARGCLIFDGESSRNVATISPYLTPGEEVYVKARNRTLSGIPNMVLGNFAKDGAHLFFSENEKMALDARAVPFLRRAFGGREYINGIARYCLWINENEVSQASLIPDVSARLARVAEKRRSSKKKETARWGDFPHRFVEIRSPDYASAIIVPRVSSEDRPYLPVGMLPLRAVVTEAFALYDAPLWAIALIASRLHITWIAAVCGKLETRYRYSNTLGWNTFPVPALTEKNKADLTRCAEDILLAREAHFPATIGDLYDPEKMPDNLREGHERNDEVLERIYIGRRFKNDTERLEKLFELYTEMTSSEDSQGASA